MERVVHLVPWFSRAACPPPLETCGSAPIKPSSEPVRFHHLAGANHRSRAVYLLETLRVGHHSRRRWRTRSFAIAHLISWPPGSIHDTWPGVASAAGLRCRLDIGFSHISPPKVHFHDDL